MIDAALRDLLRESLSSARTSGDLDVPDPEAIELTRPQHREHGDWSTNIALTLQKAAGRPPRDVAQTVLKHLPPRSWVMKAEVAGPGFINFFLAESWLHDAVQTVLEQGASYGRPAPGPVETVNVEFVSINPTGPLHIGSARNAVLGDAIARLLEFTGHSVVREYYFNDAGSQMTNFGLSVAGRYLELLGRPHHWTWTGDGGAKETKPVPKDGYHGDYVIELARRILSEDGDRHAALNVDELGEVMRERAYPIVIEWIERSLERFRVHMDVWFKERDLYARGEVEAVLAKLGEAGYIYEQDGAQWLRSTAFGDSRDRTVVRSFGSKEPTYLLPDLAYHLDKVARGADRMIVVLGSDHHGHGPSLRAGLQALGIDPARVEVLIYQWVHVLRGGEPVPMSKRAGTFVTLDELIDEVGADAARYGLLSTSSDNTLYFDIEEVKKQSLENPVYYVQYAHARIASILRGAPGGSATDADLSLLSSDAETDLMRAVSEFPDVVAVAARERAPHRLTTYSEELARRFHRFYTECRVLTDDAALTAARLALCTAARQVLANALGLLGVEAPERMERDG